MRLPIRSASKPSLGVGKLEAPSTATKICTGTISRRHHRCIEPKQDTATYRPSVAARERYRLQPTLVGEEDSLGGAPARDLGHESGTSCGIQSRQWMITELRESATSLQLFQKEIALLGIKSSPAFIQTPEGMAVPNGSSKTFGGQSQTDRGAWAVRLIRG
jgi:hypothetical protein